MELIVVRHGRPEQAHSLGGADPQLTDEGHRQAGLLAGFLRRMPDLTPDVVVTSPMRRARQTAAPIAERAGAGIDVDDRLAEFDRGAPAYVPLEDSRDDAVAQWAVLQSGEWGEHRFDPDAFERRVLAAFEDVIAAHPGRRVAVVCHGGVINTFLSAHLGRERSMFVQLGYTSFCRLKASADGLRRLHSINETPHLIVPATRSPKTGGAAVTTENTRLLVLHVLRLGGFVPADKVAARAGLDAAVVAATLSDAGDLVRERTGRLSGWMLTPDGRAEHARLLAAELDATGARPAVERAEQRFLELNEPFKQICSRWQLLPDGTPNDHSDASRDRAVVDELGALHPRAVELTAELAGALPRFARYPRDLDAAWRRVDGGEVTAFAAPLQDSYHDVWMELHQDLMSTLGRERSTADGH